jgi:CheY-like chemotaxis protein
MNAPSICELRASTAEPFVVGHPARILVADDDEGTRALESRILNRVGYSVETVCDGTSAWRALLSGIYDLLITDYRMPGISGIALVRQLRVANMMLPVVLVSGSVQSLDTVRLSLDPWMRIHSFVGKPFLVGEFLAAVGSALATS